jgi:hypothetical protein
MPVVDLVMVITPVHLVAVVVVGHMAAFGFPSVPYQLMEQQTPEAVGAAA